MTQDKDRTGETRVTSEGNFVTDDYGRDRQATPEELSLHRSNNGKRRAGMRKANANDLYPDRMVYYSGRVYQVEFRTEDTVRLVVPGQKSTMLYQPYPGSYTTFSRWDVPINSPLLFVEDELRMQLKTTGIQQWHLGDTIRVNRPGSKFHDWKGVVVDSYIACGKTWVQAFFNDISLEFCDEDVVLVSSVAA